MQAQKKQQQQNPMQTIQHPLFGISLFHWISLVKKNGGIDTQYLHKALFITIASIFTAPVRLLFKIKYEKKIQNQKVHHPPIFIIGHWRSGTTYLHELLSKDPHFCYTSLWHTLLPDSCLLLEPLKTFLSRFLPTERPMDQIKVDMDGPYEDEGQKQVFTPVVIKYRQGLLIPILGSLV